MNYEPAHLRADAAPIFGLTKAEADGLTPIRLAVLVTCDD
jgi:hypothetical protein